MNGLAYIGATSRTIDVRWKEHCRDKNRPNISQRPLYRALNECGVENFSVELIEECSPSVINEREIFWISHFDTYRNGYNDTKGGDGKCQCDEDLILNLYSKSTTIKDVAYETGYSPDTCTKVLNKNGITHQQIANQGNKLKGKRVAQIDIKTNKIIRSFDTITDAYKSIEKQFSGHIASACEGKRNRAYGYKWKYIDD